MGIKGKKLLYVLTEGGKDIGYGHITRCISILQFYPYSKLVIYAKDKENVSKFLKIQGISKDRYLFLNWHSLSFPNLRNKYVFIDSYLATEKVLLSIEKIAKKLIFYDDFKQRNYKLFKKAYVINPTFYAKDLFPYRKKNYLLGPKYLMLRKAFYKLKPKKINKKVKNIFLSLGGSSHNIKIKLISEILNLLKSKNYNVLIPKNLNDEGIKNLMEKADIAISAGGQTILELARVGVPTISIALADNQMPNLKHLISNNLTFFAGWWDDEFLIENIKKGLEFYKDYNLRKEVSKKLQNLFDGKGTLRIINSTLGERITS